VSTVSRMRAVASDGTVATAVDEGIGTPILVLHGGMGDDTTWAKVTDRLNQQYRTVRLYRRQYRLDLGPRPVDFAQEVQHVVAVAAELDRPVLVGHSSGAVLALEAMAAEPERYSGAVLYEPPLIVDRPLGGESLARARLALAKGKPGTAFGIFLRDVVGFNPLFSRGLGFLINRQPSMRDRVERQLDDAEAIDKLGVRLDAYAKIELPILLLGGDKSPRHLGERLDALAATLPRCRRLVMHGEGHGAEDSSPDRVARAIAKHIDDEIAPRL
jgi:pimeloyl-ACP methyl ester carboxylesterase